MDYLHTYPNVYLRYYASDMILHIDSDAAYLVLPKARSRIAGFYQLSDHPSKTKNPTRNLPILIECKTLRHVVASAAEAEVAGIFHNAQTAIPIRRALEALDHPQPPTPLKTDNSTAHSFTYRNIQMKKSKSWDMRYHWLRDKITHKIIKVFWKEGSDNNADYSTKNHPIKHHLQKRPTYVLDKPDSSVNHIISDIKNILTHSGIARVC